MAIEIKEINIKLTVKSRGVDSKEKANELTHSAKNQIVKECVERVLQKLESKIER